MDDHPLLNDPRGHAETPTQYAAVNKENPALGLDGTHIQPVLLTMLPTSRRFVTQFLHRERYAAD